VLKAALRIAKHMQGASVVNMKVVQKQLWVALSIAVHMEGASVVNIMVVQNQL